MTGCFAFWVDNGYGVIAPSRPGWARTPMDVGKKPDEAADSFAELLDELGIEKVVVHCVSGGGPTGINFAARHPEKT